jgi:hypothetical protein
VIVANRLTPLDAREAGRALLSAYSIFTGALPNDRVGALLMAQSALETGNWQKIHNFNFGNIKARVEYPTITQFTCSEIINGIERFFDPPDPQCNFRAYATASEGALDYLKVLHGQPHWWQGLHTGDPSAFVDALATPPKYFTADPAKYKRALTALFEQFRPLVTALRGPPVQRGVLTRVSASPGSSSARPPSSAPSITGPGGGELGNAAVLSPRSDATAAAIVGNSPVAAGDPKSSTPPPASSSSETTTEPNMTLPAKSTGAKGERGAIRIVEDAANAIVVAADAADAIASTTAALPPSNTARQAAAVVRVVRWVAQFVNWLLAVLRLRTGATRKP